MYKVENANRLCTSTTEIKRIQLCSALWLRHTPWFLPPFPSPASFYVHPVSVRFSEVVTMPYCVKCDISTVRLHSCLLLPLDMTAFLETFTSEGFRQKQHWEFEGTLVDKVVGSWPRWLRGAAACNGKTHWRRRSLELTMEKRWLWNGIVEEDIWT